MDFTFNEEYNRKVRDEWVNLINHRPITPKIVRPEILEAWQLCMERGLDPYKHNPKLLTNEEFELRLKNNKLMCDIALPFMTDIYEIIRGSLSIVSILDKDSYILVTFRDKIYDEYLSVNGYIPGTNQAESSSGLIETFLCQKYKKPFWCWDEENFFVSGKGWACAAAPILDSGGNLQGILNVSSESKNANPHTMGMVISAAKAIENQMLMHIAHEKITNIANQLSATIESVPQGMIVVDCENKISSANSFAKRILSFDEEDNIINLPIDQVLIDEENAFTTRPLPTLPEHEIILKTKAGFQRYYITSKTLSSETPNNNNWTLIILKEMKYARKFANNLISSYARFSFSDIVGHSKKLNDAIALGKIAAKSTSTVLLTGSSGTGKELFAHSIHSESSRSSGPFISINCGALPPGLVESELFGYESGAFTGARKEGQVGKFELADNGTLFLDEIGEMPLSVQASILRAIETKEVTRIGGTKTNLINVRIIAATNKDLLGAIKEKQFREDLYYRLNVLRIDIPDLRERKDDIRLLANKFLKTYSQKLQKDDLHISEDTYAVLKAYDWPGNVRELENIIERAVNVSETSSIITPELIKQFISIGQQPTSDIDLSKDASTTRIKKTERDLIIKVLEENKGNFFKSAEIIGIGRRTLYRKCEEYNIDPNMFRKAIR